MGPQFGAWRDAKGHNSNAESQKRLGVESKMRRTDGSSIASVIAWHFRKWFANDPQTIRKAIGNSLQTSRKRIAIHCHRLRAIE